MPFKDGAGAKGTAGQPQTACGCSYCTLFLSLLKLLLLLLLLLSALCIMLFSGRGRL